MAQPGGEAMRSSGRVGGSEAGLGAPRASSGWTQSGWLEKKEGNDWKRLWCTVDGDQVHCFETEASMGGTRVGSMSLAGAVVDHSTAVTADVGEIEIKAGSRTHRIQCGTDTLAEEWIEALNAAKDGRTPERPTRSSSRPSRAASQKAPRRTGGKAPKHPWTEEEDEKLVSLIRAHGANQWANIAKEIPGRVGKQCRERWQNHLNPDVNRAAEWSEEEERALFEWHETLGNKWADIAKHLPGRTDNSVKNYYHKRVGQIKRGAAAARPKKSIEKKFSLPKKPLVAALERQSSSGSLDLNPAEGAAGVPELGAAIGASPTPPRPARSAAPTLSRSRSDQPRSKGDGPPPLRARRHTLGDEPVSPSARENVDAFSPARTSSGPGSARRGSGTGVLKEKNEIESGGSLHNRKLVPAGAREQGQAACGLNMASPMVGGSSGISFSKPAQRANSGPWMSGVNRTSLDALSMETSLPTVPREPAHQAAALVPETLGPTFDEADMMDTASPGLLAGGFGVSPAPRFGSGMSCGSEMGCAGLGSPLAFYSPRLGV